MGLADRAAHRPSELSGGQQQRVAIARALVNRPTVIMGDEPTGNLDTASSAEVIDMMREINLLTGTTFILVTHDPDVAAACDRVIHMRDGVVTDDTSRLVPAPALEGAGRELEKWPESPRRVSAGCTAAYRQAIRVPEGDVMKSFDQSIRGFCRDLARVSAATRGWPSTSPASRSSSGKRPPGAAARPSRASRCRRS